MVDLSSNVKIGYKFSRILSNRRANTNAITLPIIGFLHMAIPIINININISELLCAKNASKPKKIEAFSLQYVALKRKPNKKGSAIYCLNMLLDNKTKTGLIKITGSNIVLNANRFKIAYSKNITIKSNIIN